MKCEIRDRASLLLNAVLVPIVVVLVVHRLNRVSPSPSMESSAATITNGSSINVPNESTALMEQPILPQYGSFTSASDRRRMMVDQLRAMGVPNDLLALVARVDFEMQWDSRFEECRGDMDKLAAVQLELNLRKDAEMRAALGEEGFRKWDQKNMLWEAMSTEVDVSASEAAAMYDLKKKLQQRQFEVEQARLKGTMDDVEIGEAYDKAYMEYNQQLRTVLGDDRYARSQQIDKAFVSDIFRHELAKAHPTDAQFDELFKAEQERNRSRAELDREFQNDPSSPDYQAKIQALDAMRDRQYQQVLGKDAFDNYRKEQDPTFSQMKKYETLWGLDNHKIDYVYDAMKQYEKSVEDYKAQVLARQAQGQDVDWDAVTRTLQHSADQTQQTLQNYLGEDTFDRLQRNRVLRWASLGFQPRPARDGSGERP